LLQIVDEGCGAWAGADDEMGLETNTIDLDACVLQVLDYGKRSVRLGARSLDIVIVVVKLRVGISGGSGSKRDIYVVCA
jgi:hypothetical protein